jgi:hypothetical protein
VLRLRGGAIRPALALASALLIPMAQECAPPNSNDPPGNNSATIHSCSPDYTDENKLGRLSVSQRGPKSTVRWGAFPKLPASRYVVQIYVGSKVVDGKNQYYQPHGSLPWKNRRGQIMYKSGQVFKLVGTSYDAKGNVVQKFFIKCRLV